MTCKRSQVKVDEVGTVDSVLTFCIPRLEFEPFICYHYPMIDEELIRQKAKEEDVTHFATGIAVFQDGRLLVVRRVAHDDFLAGEWELPGGGVDAGETIEQGAVRELKEETGIEVSPDKLDPAPDKVEVFNKNGKYQNSIYYFTYQISDLAEIGLDSISVPKSQLQKEEVDWAGFIDIKDAYHKVARAQLIILDRLS